MCNIRIDIQILTSLHSGISGPAGKGVDMGFDIKRAREVHFSRMQKALEQGLKDINMARTPSEADEARKRAQARIEELNQMFEDAFPAEEVDI